MISHSFHRSSSSCLLNAIIYCIVFVVGITHVIAGTNQEGLDFLEKNKDADGVIVLPSGLQYKVLNKGNGIYHPGISTSCKCHYSGQLIDGTVFDSSYDRGEPTSFAPNQVIKGWTEIMQLMVEGDKYEIYVPSELGYGDSGSPPKIPGGSVLIFTMEIIEITGTGSIMAIKCNIVNNENCNDKEIDYIKKVATWNAAADKKPKDELIRLQKMDQKKMKSELAEWIERRMNILKQYDSSSADLKKAEEL